MVHQSEESIDMHGCFADMPDPRSVQNRQYKLADILYITLCAVICGMDNWVDIQDFAECKIAWFRKKLALKNGVPSHDTFGRVFSMLNPKAFQERFFKWVQTINKQAKTEFIAIDGKSSRCSDDKASGKKMLHTVSAWCVKNGLVLGQTAVDDKSNEITAIPELIEILELRDCIVTIDAMGCQKNIVQKIRKKKADYVLALKGNQRFLHEDVELYFKDAEENDFRDADFSYHKTVDKDHGRIEIREYWTTDDVDWLEDKSKWDGLTSIGMVHSTRIIGEKTSKETRLYISSLPSNTKVFADAVRGHWAIENSLHWVLDVVFRDDTCRIRKNHSPRNFATMRHVALNLIKMGKHPKQSIQFSRKRASWDEAFLELLLENL